MKITIKVKPEQVKNKIISEYSTNELVLKSEEREPYEKCPILWNTFTQEEQKIFNKEQQDLLKNKRQALTKEVHYSIISINNEEII